MRSRIMALSFTPMAAVGSSKSRHLGIGKNRARNRYRLSLTARELWRFQRRRLGMLTPIPFELLDRALAHGPII